MTDVLVIFNNEKDSRKLWPNLLFVGTSTSIGSEGASRLTNASTNMVNPTLNRFPGKVIAVTDPTQIALYRMLNTHLDKPGTKKV